jgi:hypothetical protein
MHLEQMLKETQQTDFAPEMKQIDKLTLLMSHNG